MFKLFKKKKLLNSAKDDTDETQAADTKKTKLKDYKAEVEKNVVIYTIPKKFREIHEQKSNAQKTGLLILIGGVIFLIIVSVLLYYYLFKAAPSSPKPPAATTDIQLEETPVEPVKTPPASPSEQPEAVIETSVSPIIEDDVATSTATTTEPSIIVVGLIPGTDSDSDGLTDKEEYLFGSDLNSADSDEDGYSDLMEVISLYNPAGTGKLVDRTNILQYVNNAYNYKLIYPISWAISNIGGDDSVILRSSDNHFIQIIVQPNENEESIENWFKRQFDVVSINDSLRVEADSWQGIKNENGLTIYLIDIEKKNIYTITYNLGNSNTKEYKNIFEMIIKSFEVFD